MPVFYATLDPEGIATGAKKAKSEIEQVGDAFDAMTKKGAKAEDQAASTSESLSKAKMSSRGVYGLQSGLASMAIAWARAIRSRP